VSLPALGSDRSDQARVITLDVADPRAHRPACHPFRGKRRQQGLERGCIGGVFSEPNPEPNSDLLKIGEVGRKAGLGLKRNTADEAAEDFSHQSDYRR
jgi:hypothetical protein